MFYLSENSKKRLSTCHRDLQLIIETAISISNVDFGVAEGLRSRELQAKYFREGKSKLDGKTRLSKHNYKPALAVDIFAYVNGKASWDKETMSYLAGLIHAVSEIFYNQRRTSHLIRWGGNWDMDGIILYDQSFDDRPHYELIYPDSNRI